MTVTDAAAEVLRLVGRPLHYKEITDLAIEKNLLSHVGKSPEVTMGARLAAMLKKDSPENPLVRVKPGVFALREWDEKTIKAGLEPKKGGKKGAKAESHTAKGRASKVEEVEGEGVVGEQPYLRPGERFEYTSGAVLETDLGMMRGGYKMLADDGTRFEAPIPAFTLTVPRTLH